MTRSQARRILHQRDEFTLDEAHEICVALGVPSFLPSLGQTGVVTREQLIDIVRTAPQTRPVVNLHTRSATLAISTRPQSFGLTSRGERIHLRPITTRTMRDSIDVAMRSVVAVIATENPVSEFDHERRQTVPTMVLMDGVTLPSSRQVALLDSHNRDSVDSILGSVRDLHVEHNPPKLVGTLTFSSVHEHAFGLVRDGHLTDVSAGFTVQGTDRIRAGQARTFMGRRIEGPANVITRWTLHETSLVVIGADDGAKVRG